MICAITSYYNPLGWKSRLRNYQQFRAKLHCPLITVELNSNEIDDAIHLQSPDLLWQKERLLNVALDHLPPNCEIVCWIDADIVWENDFCKQVETALTKYDLVQMFSVCKREKQNQVRSITLGGNGGNGLAWCAKREDIEATRFFDYCIVGSGDSAFYCGASGNAWRHNVPRELKKEWEQWGVKASEVFKRISCLPTTCKHFYHGRAVDRRYRSRWRLLNGFAPSDLLLVDQAYQWTTEARPRFAHKLEDYFRGRREDS